MRIFSEMQSFWKNVGDLVGFNIYLWASVIKDFSNYPLSLIFLNWSLFFFFFFFVILFLSVLFF